MVKRMKNKTKAPIIYLFSLWTLDFILLILSFSFYSFYCVDGKIEHQKSLFYFFGSYSTFFLLTKDFCAALPILNLDCVKNDIKTKKNLWKIFIGLISIGLMLFFTHHIFSY
ncbi:hypothetical protein PA0695 [Candidatus Phytoplasma australiense]|uniref:Uncharacterized protein n=1 Tax=Phytoplasma australiense TaxID=59748 RepID=B1VAQ6_PHYAS|nr:hypothetical protein PA0695 [Candidatus Phytoplasma australiense]